MDTLKMNYDKQLWDKNNIHNSKIWFEMHWKNQHEIIEENNFQVSFIYAEN